MQESLKNLQGGELLLVTVMQFVEKTGSSKAVSVKITMHNDHCNCNRNTLSKSKHVSSWQPRTLCWESTTWIAYQNRFQNNLCCVTDIKPLRQVKGLNVCYKLWQGNTAKHGYLLRALFCRFWGGLTPQGVRTWLKNSFEYNWCNVMFM